MKQKCELCGGLHDDKWMMSYSSGRSTHWFCWDCWKIGQGEAAANEIRRKHLTYAELNKRK